MGASRTNSGASNPGEIGEAPAERRIAHTVFMLRSAHLYYSDPVGGIDFHADDLPDYRDIAYVALTLGMTFQVSDTDLTARSIRRTSIKHALLSYVFGAVILAITINIVASLAK